MYKGLTINAEEEKANSKQNKSISPNRDVNNFSITSISKRGKTININNLLNDNQKRDKRTFSGNPIFNKKKIIVIPQKNRDENKINFNNFYLSKNLAFCDKNKKLKIQDYKKGLCSDKISAKKRNDLEPANYFVSSNKPNKNDLVKNKLNFSENYDKNTLLNEYNKSLQNNIDYSKKDINNNNFKSNSRSNLKDFNNKNINNSIDSFKKGQNNLPLLKEHNKNTLKRNKSELPYQIIYEFKGVSNVVNNNNIQKDNKKNDSICFYPKIKEPSYLKLNIFELENNDIFCGFVDNWKKNNKLRINRWISNSDYNIEKEKEKEISDIIKICSDKNLSEIEILNKLKVLDNVINQQIHFIRENKIKKYYTPYQKLNSQNIEFKFLGFLGSELEGLGLKVFIEERQIDEEINKNIFYIIYKALEYQVKYDLKFLSGEVKKKLDKNPDFINKIKNNIKEEVFKSDRDKDKIKFFNDPLENNSLIFTTGCGQNEIIYPDFGKDIKVSVNTLLRTIIISPDIFDRKYNRKINYLCWENLLRGGEVYDPPLGWYGFGLKVLGKFDNGNNSWLGKDGNKGEWAVGYHSIGKRNNILKVIKIINEGLKEGKKQDASKIENIRGEGLCGKGVYLTPKIECAERYADIMYISEIGMKIVIMCRVNPLFIREPKGMPNEWIVNGNSNEVRPYRILIKIF